MSISDHTILADLTQYQDLLHFLNYLQKNEQISHCDFWRRIAEIKPKMHDDVVWQDDNEGTFDRKQLKPGNTTVLPNIIRCCLAQLLTTLSFDRIAWRRFQVLRHINTQADFYYLLQFLYSGPDVTPSDVSQFLSREGKFGGGNDGTINDSNSVNIADAHRYAKLERWDPKSDKELPSKLYVNIEELLQAMKVDTEKFLSYNKMHNLPDRLPYFVGRTKHLETLNQKFLNYNTGINLVGKKEKVAVSLGAVGGQGKTALSLEYGYRYFRSHYSCILWFDARRGLLQSQLRQFCIERCKIPSFPADSPDFKDVKEQNYFFEQLTKRFQKHCLIIIDDASNDNQINKFLPKNGVFNIHFLITSRKKLLARKGDIMELPVLENEEAGALFINRSKIPDIKPEDSKLQAFVAKDGKLGGHALSISLMGAYARQQQQYNLDALIELIDKYGVGQTSEHIELDDYAHQLHAAFNLSFDCLKQESQDTLLLLSLFPRIEILGRVLRRCVLGTRSQLPREKRLREYFKDHRNTELKELEKYHLVQFSDKTKHFSLHEAIYDFARVKFGIGLQKNEDMAAVNKGFLQSSITFTEKLTDEHKLVGKKDCLGFVIQDISSELSAVTGLLMPKIDAGRGMTPNYEHLLECLRFWFRNYRFHQYIYDTEILDFIRPNIESVKKHLVSLGCYEGLNQFILDKLLGHAFYADPKRLGKKAERLFKQALETSLELHKSFRKQSAQLQQDLVWYDIFLIDHMINVASKRRGDERAVIPVPEDPEYAADIRRLESSLPPRLLDLSSAIEPVDYPLLLRAAHYWGHRGNQDQYTLLKQFVNDKTNKRTEQLVEAAKRHYKCAANYRLAALRIHFPERYFYQKDFNLKNIPYACDWIQELAAPDKQTSMEDFTHYFQGIGDTAHQLRGIHFVEALHIAIQLKRGNSNISTDTLERSLAAAKKLWDHACYRSTAQHQVRAEQPLKYVLWMCSSEILHDLMLQCISNCYLLPWEQVKKKIKQAVENMQRELKISYDFVVEEQENQIKEIWDSLDCVYQK
ncbi:hypothetical protein [Aliikangiella maris]|uniref:NB-ARC domain-containing protein n=2 Tax=Aliikangiella maris TaxID=3162458 RepID=A0ABV3MV22_9GAMM